MKTHITAYVHSTVSFNSRNSRLFCLQLLRATQHHTPVPFRNSLTNRDLSHTSWNEVKELSSQRYLSLSFSVAVSYLLYLKDKFCRMGMGYIADNGTEIIPAQSAPFSRSSWTIFHKTAATRHVILQQCSVLYGRKWVVQMQVYCSVQSMCHFFVYIFSSLLLS
jgi:hypothetical protein